MVPAGSWAGISSSQPVAEPRPHQRMIRALVVAYAERQEKAAK
jgi:hypothetical protein